jgi:hypothetical protein
LARFGVSVQAGVIMLEYINQLRARGHSIEDSAIECAVLRGSFGKAIGVSVVKAFDAISDAFLEGFR